MLRNFFLANETLWTRLGTLSKSRIFMQSEIVSLRNEEGVPVRSFCRSSSNHSQPSGQTRTLSRYSIIIQIVLLYYSQPSGQTRTLSRYNLSIQIVLLYYSQPSGQTRTLSRYSIPKLLCFLRTPDRTAQSF